MIIKINEMPIILCYFIYQGHATYFRIFQHSYNVLVLLECTHGILYGWLEIKRVGNR